MAERNKGLIYQIKKKSIELGAFTQPKVLTGLLLSIGGMYLGLPGAEIIASYAGGWYLGDKVQDELVDPGGSIRQEVYAKRGEKPGLWNDLKRATGIGSLRFWGKSSRMAYAT